MRKQLMGAAGVAIIGAFALSACDMLGGGGDDAKKKDDASEASSGGNDAGGSAEESSGGKPDEGGAEAGGDAGGDAGGAGGGAAGGAAGGSGGGGDAGKPDEEAASQAQSTSSGQVRRAGDVPDDFAQLMQVYLDYYVQNFGQGFGRSGVDDVVTGLRAGQEYRWNVGTLRGGQTYRFFGACDDDCTDVDIVVEDENGIEVGADTLTDDYPVVTITPRHDGPFTVRILLVNCSIEPCYVGGRVLQQGR